MNNLKKLLPILLSLAMFSACGGDDSSTTASSSEAVNSSEPSSSESTTSSDTEFSETEDSSEADGTLPEGSVYAEFTNGMPAEGWECSDGWTNGSVFNVTWRKSNVTFKGGNMQLIVDKDKTPADGIPYSGGEFRTLGFYGYGRYEVSMKAIKNDGVVSSFFTYTGPYDNNPWDEIDVEILGKDTTKVQFNYFTDSKGEHEYMHDLGFDASEDFHTYAFEWYEDKIIWYVDGTEVHRATENIPSTKGKIMMNAWCGKDVDDWLSPFDDKKIPLTAEYEWIKYTPFN